MILKKTYYFFLLVIFATGCSAKNTNQSEKSIKVDSKNYKKLTEEEIRVIINKGTEYPFSGIYNDFKNKGVFNCKQCGTPLFKSESKFNSRCGWPSFDDAIDGNVKEILDIDGKRIEIVCNNCEGHLGHVFRGENFTELRFFILLLNKKKQVKS